MIRFSHNISSVDQLMSIIKDIKKQGFIQGTDFDFEYHKPVYDEHYDEVTPRHVVLLFHNEKLVTWYGLKYL
jgi:hypothetical protein